MSVKNSNSLGDLPEVSDIVSLDSELSFMYIAYGWELPPLLTDLFIISEDVPLECSENCFSCSLKDIKWAESAAVQNRDENRHTCTHAIAA